MGFKSFLINENKSYLGQKVGDILTALQSLQDDSKNMGNRPLIKSCTGIVNQIRRVLKDNWSEENMKTLESLQKVGVAISSAIDSNDDLSEVIASSVQELESTTKASEMPINDIGSPEDEPES